MQSGVEGFSSAQRLAGRVDELPDRISADAAALIDRVMDVRDAARQIAGPDEMAVVRELGLEAQMADAQDTRAAIEALIADASVVDLTIGLQVFAFDPSSG